MQRIRISWSKKPSRQRILELYKQGLSTHEVATKLCISDTWARRVKQEFRESGKTANARTRKRVASWHRFMDAIQSAIARKPDMTLSELAAELNNELSVSTLFRALKALKLTLKKRRLSAASNNGPK